MQSWQLNSGQEPNAAHCRCWNTSLPTELCMPDPPCRAPQGPSSTGHPSHPRNCSHFPGLCPSLQQHKSHWILLSTEHPGKANQSTPLFLHRRHSTITRYGENRGEQNVTCVFPQNCGKGRKEKGPGLSDNCAESSIAPTFSESHKSVWVLCFWNKSTVKASLFTLDTVQRLFLKINAWKDASSLRS